MKGLKHLTTNIYIWTALWLAFLTYYSIAVNYGYGAKNADYVAYGVQLVADLSIGIFSFLAYRKAIDKTVKKFLLFLFISTAIGLCANEIYNILFNIVKWVSISDEINVSWIVLYTLFLVGQIISWTYLLYVNREKVLLENKKWFARLPFFQFAILLALSVFILVIFITNIFKNEAPESTGIIQMINTVMETVLFIILSMCLSKSKVKSLSFIATGFLLLIAFNMAQRFSYMTGHYYKTFDIAWLGSYLFAIYGFGLFLDKINEKFDLFEKNSLYVLTSATFALFSSLIFLLFIIFEFFITSLEINRIANVKILLENIPSILIFSFTLSVLASKLVAGKLSKPLEKVSQRIDLIQDKKLDINEIPNEKFEIVEIDKLDKFILRTIAQLHIANRVKSEFLMNMSHDLRTPASGVHSMAKLIHEKISDNKLKRLQKLVVDSSRQLLDLLDDVLDYSKSESDSTKPRLTEIDIGELINDIVLFMAAKAEEKGLSINSILLEKSVLYKGDPVVLRRILVNVVSNAVKFTQNGSVTVSAYEKQEFNFKNIIIKVKDTGIGIDKQYHEAIFDPFFRVESSETSQYAGVGLGLSNVRLMLNKLNGKISVESCLGQGSTFTIFLPNLS